MQSYLRNPVRVACACGGLVLATSILASDDIGVTGTAARDWVGPREAVTIDLGVEAQDSERIAVFIGNNDLTALFHRRSRSTLTYAADLHPLPAGEQEIVVYRISDAGSWQELHRETIRVTTSSGLEVSEWRPRADITGKSLLDENSDDPLADPPRRNEHDFALQAGLASRHKGRRGEFRSAMNVLGSTVAEEALRFGTMGSEAPRVDLSDYLVEYENGNSTFALGHVAFGNQPLLLSGLGNRGLGYRYRAGERFDLALTLQNGKAIAGYNNLFGLNNSQNQVAAMSAGLELVGTRPGAVRVELMLVDATTQSLLDFNIGDVPDAEKNRGAAIRFAAASSGGRIRASLNFARSRYTNTEDPFLSQGLELVPVRETTSSAGNAEVGLIVLENRPFLDIAPVTLMATLRHEFADALYRAFGSSTAPGLIRNAIAIDGSIGQIAFQALADRSEDNPDDIPTILKTRTDNLATNLTIPLQRLLLKEGPARRWLPQALSHSYQRTHQLGINRPPEFDPLTHIPDQMTNNHNAVMSWSFGRLDLGYQFSYGVQDNRQPGRANADFSNRSHGVNMTLNAVDGFIVSVGANLVEATDKEQDLVQDTWTYNLGVDWALAKSLSIRGNYSLVEGDDSRLLTENRNYMSQTELTWRFEVPVGQFRRLPGQFFLRHSIQGSRSIDNVFGLSQDTLGWSINAGFNISLL